MITKQDLYEKREELAVKKEALIKEQIFVDAQITVVEDFIAKEEAKEVAENESVEPYEENVAVATDIIG